MVSNFHYTGHISDRLLGERKGFQVIKTYEAVALRWEGQQLKQLTELYRDAHRGKF
jgi:hypothetical protein